MKLPAIACLTLLGLSQFPALEAAEKPVSLGTLLDDMVDRTVLPAFPSPAFTCRQFSSYDQKSTTADDQDTWFANGDCGQYLRVEENGGRQEWVMMDADGPGAVVRIWSANPQGNLRVYLDGAETPAIEAPMTDVLGGAWKVARPLSAERSRGWNLYLPIPYAKHCKVTSDAGGFYYQVNYRTYEPGTDVKSFSLAALEAEREKLERVQEALVAPDRSRPKDWATFAIPAGMDVTFPLPEGPHAIKQLWMKLEHEDLPEALRTTVLELQFDGEITVWCPVGDFFGTGAGLSPLGDWWRTVREDGLMTCRWVMPYQSQARATLFNHGESPVTVRIAADLLDHWKWDERSMHFHATWRQENPIHTRPMRDWNYVEIKGRGVYVGDNLAVANPVKDWWGEGDEKIWVDGEQFPSHFGTGTEDYYGYAWCCPEPFQAPFHNQPRCDGPNNYGHTLISRVRSLDGIPFESSFKFDMEVWHWKECDEGYAATAYFYAAPGARTNRAPSPGEAARGLLDPIPLPPPFKIEGAIECEEMAVVSATEGIPMGPQGGYGPKLWSGEHQFWVQGKQPGDQVQLEFPCEGKGPFKLEVFATRSWDYGIVLFSINGKSTDVRVDLFNTEGKAVAATGPIDLGIHQAKDGKMVLGCEVVGGNPASEGSRSFFGLDCVRLTPVN
ncbi:MAG: glycoside hydrolase family 172 protein [Planctomycetota bacterium]